MRVLLTGASGFVGSHTLRHLLVNTDWEIVCPVTFTHKGLPARVQSAVCDQVWQPRVTVVHWDLRSSVDTLTRRAIGPVDVILNVASESHVDRSIEEPVPFIGTNVALMLHVLEFARSLPDLRLLLQMSTDEVYGPAQGDTRHKEWDPVVPSNPYSASKAAQEAVAISYWRTYGVPLVLTNTMNILGEMQDPEKYLPKIIRALWGRPGDPETVPVHMSSDGRPGSRFYLHARNLADAWLWLTRRYTSGGEDVPQFATGATRPERLHIVGEREVDNVELVHLVGASMGLSRDYVQSRIQPVDFHSTRPGHDPRYALDGSKIAALGWRAPYSLEQSLAQTVDWTLKNPDWLDI